MGSGSGPGSGSGLGCGPDPSCRTLTLTLYLALPHTNPNPSPNPNPNPSPTGSSPAATRRAASAAPTKSATPYHPFATPSPPLATSCMGALVSSRLQPGCNQAATRLQPGCNRDARVGDGGSVPSRAVRVDRIARGLWPVHIAALLQRALQGAYWSNRSCTRPGPRRPSALSGASELSFRHFRVPAVFTPSRMR